MKVFITQNIEQESIDLLEANGVEVRTSGVDGPLSREEFLSSITDVDAIIFVWHTEIMDKAAFEVAKNLKIIARRGVGHENIDLEEAKKRNIPVTVTPVHTNTIADLTFGLLINAARKIHLADAFVRNGEWKEAGVSVARKFMGYDVHHKKIGIIGLGKIGKHMVQRAKGFEMEVSYYDVFRQVGYEIEMNIEYKTLDDLLATSDFISINCAFTESTRNLIDAKAIAKMKSNAIIVVSARGGIIDEVALYEALKEKRIAAAGLDVFDPEPIDANSPLLQLENTVFTPHLGASVQETRVLMAVTAAEDVIRVLKNQEPLYPLFSLEKI
jgi:D-3-phosphoglycerate dehydrogenase